MTKLPLHDIPPGAGEHTAGALVIDGLVARAGTAGEVRLRALERVRHDGDFACTRGWTATDLHWEGVPLTAVIALAGPRPDARYVRVHAGDYVLPLPLEDAGSAVLCDVLDGEPLAREHGAPWRLLLPAGVCFTSVKWVERLELAATPGENTAEVIAAARA